MERPEPCPECGTTRRSRQDVETGYCNRCHWFTFDSAMVEIWREQWPDKAADAAAYRALVRIGQAR
jgi:Zn-finger nucleic acid-binding protein